MSASLPKHKKLVPISEAARVLGVSIDTIRRWDKSGVLHSERADGKNRYFSLNELEEYKNHQPLPISEVSKQLRISPTTLRRLEAKGLFVPTRNQAGERIYDKELVEDFLRSDYFLRKTSVKKTVPEPAQKEITSPKDLDLDSKSQLFESQSQADVKGPAPEIPTEVTEKVVLDLKLMPWQRFPEILATTAIFGLLIAIGMTNIAITSAKDINTSRTQSVLSATKEVPSPIPSATPSIPLVTIEAVVTESSSAAEVQTSTPSATPSASPIKARGEVESTTSADVVISSVIRIITVVDGAENVNIHLLPLDDSKTIGQAESGDTFESIALVSDWYQIRLADGSIGFISASVIKEKETPD